MHTGTYTHLTDHTHLFQCHNECHIILFIQPCKPVLVMITLSTGVSRVFVPQREADVHRSGTWRCRKRPRKGNIKAAVWVNVTSDTDLGKEICMCSYIFFFIYLHCNKEVEVIKSCQERMRRHLDRAIAQLAWVWKIKLMNDHQTQDSI